MCGMHQVHSNLNSIQVGSEVYTLRLPTKLKLTSDPAPSYGAKERASCSRRIFSPHAKNCRTIFIYPFPSTKFLNLQFPENLVTLLRDSLIVLEKDYLRDRATIAVTLQVEEFHF